MSEVKLSSKNQIVFPADARRALSVASGDRLLITIVGSVAVVMPKPERFSRALRGRGKGLYSSDYLAKERAAWK